MSAKAIVVGVIMAIVFCPWLTPFWIILGIIAGITTASIVQEEDNWYAKNHEVIISCNNCRWGVVCTRERFNDGCNKWKEKEVK